MLKIDHWVVRFVSYLNHCRIVQGTYGRGPTSKLSKLSGLGEDTLAATEQGPAGWGPDGVMVTGSPQNKMLWNERPRFCSLGLLKRTCPMSYGCFSDLSQSLASEASQTFPAPISPYMTWIQGRNVPTFDISHQCLRHQAQRIHDQEKVCKFNLVMLVHHFPRVWWVNLGEKQQVEGLPHYSCWQMHVLNVPHPIRIKHPPHVPSFAERWAARNPARKWLACRQRRRKNVPRRCQPQMRTDGLRGLRVKVHGIQLFNDHTNELKSTMASFVALQLLEYPNLPSTATFRAI